MMGCGLEPPPQNTAGVRGTGRDLLLHHPLGP